MNRRLNLLKTVLWTLVGAWAMVAFARFATGLGATTNLNNAAPWGIWIGLDVMAGVALAAGGFVMTAGVYIFRLEKYRPLVRPAILTALLGYLAVSLGLLHDLGVPWRIWHPLIYGQPQSVMFEVAMCVMCYLTVLALEFSPVVLTHPWFRHPVCARILALLKKATLPLVIAGIVLSTLHQSSLGSLFLIAPHRVHPLWYSPLLYLHFFISAVGLGLMTVTMESLLGSWFLGHKLPKPLLAGIGKVTSVVLILYAIIRILDVSYRGAFAAGSDLSLDLSFLIELLLGAIIPGTLLAFPGIRGRTGGLAACATMVIVGTILNRFNLSMIAFARTDGFSYFPHWMELTITAGIFSGAILVFLFCCENLPVYGAERAPEKTKSSRIPAGIPAYRRYSLFALCGAALVAGLLPESAVSGASPRPTPVEKPVKCQALVVPRQGEKSSRAILLASDYLIQAPGVQTALLLDGNRSGRRAIFTHASHALRAGDCRGCHHLGQGKDGKFLSCSSCHRDMFETVDTFNHQDHVAKLDGKKGCDQCHQDPAAPKTRKGTRSCLSCHREMAAPSARIKRPDKAHSGFAPSYMKAMHRQCQRCHRKISQTWEKPARKAFLRCSGCH